MGLSTDVAAMNTAADHVTQVNEQLQGTINNLRTRCEGAAGNWEGGAAVKFQDLIVRYNDASNRMRESLVTISDQIRQNGKGYDESDQANQDAITQAGASGGLDIPTIL